MKDTFEIGDSGYHIEALTKRRKTLIDWKETCRVTGSKCLNMESVASSTRFMVVMVCVHIYVYVHIHIHTCTNYCFGANFLDSMVLFGDFVLRDGN